MRVVGCFSSYTVNILILSVSTLCPSFTLEKFGIYVNTVYACVHVKLNKSFHSWPHHLHPVYYICRRTYVFMTATVFDV